MPEGFQRTTITGAGENDPNLLHVFWFDVMVRDVHEARAFSVRGLGDLDPSSVLSGTIEVPALVRHAGPKCWVMLCPVYWGIR